MIRRNLTPIALIAIVSLALLLSLYFLFHTKNAQEDDTLAQIGTPCSNLSHIDVSFRCADVPVFETIHNKRFEVDRLKVVILSPKHRIIDVDDAGQRDTSRPLNANPESAIWMIPGGPGQEADIESESLLLWADWMTELKVSQDVIFYSPRGTYGTELYWRCDPYENKSLRILSENLSTYEEAKRLQEITSRCIAQYQTHIIDTIKTLSGALPDMNPDNALSLLSTTANVRDLDYLMDYFPYRSAHVWATSYGTRVALLTENIKIKTRILDSVYPINKGLPSEFPRLLFDSTMKHQKMYADNMAGADGYGPESYYPRPSKGDEGPHSAYYRLMNKLYEKLQHSPQQYRLELWHNRETVPFILNGDRFLNLQFNILYDTRQLEMFYTALQNIEEKPDEMRWVLESYVNDLFSPTFNTMLFFATECVDNQPVSEDMILHAVASLKHVVEKNYGAHSAPIDAILRQRWQDLNAIDVCADPIFDGMRTLSDFSLRHKTYAHYPSLILSGDLDPITPTSWAEELTPLLRGAIHMNIEQAGHAVLSDDHCDWQTIKTFWDTGDPSHVRCFNVTRQAVD